MTKIVINTCYGGFGLTRQAEGFGVNSRTERNDPKLVKAVETLGDDAGGSFSQLRVIEIPDDVDWEICEYDGMEWIAEKHRTWEYEGD